MNTHPLPASTNPPIDPTFLLSHPPRHRKDLLRYLLLDLPTIITKRQATITNLARSLDISRITASAFFNMTQAQFPLSLKMAVKLYLATQHYLPAVRVLAQLPTSTLPPAECLWVYPTDPEDWLRLDDNYKEPSVEDQIEDLISSLQDKVKVLARV